jgi:hypothetical protein
MALFLAGPNTFLNTTAARGIWNAEVTKQDVPVTGRNILPVAGRILCKYGPGRNSPLFQKLAESRRD